MGSDLLTNSRLKCARACQRKHKLQYIDGYRSAADAEALRFGTLIHRGLEAWWKAPAEARLDAALAALAGETDPFDLVRAQCLLTGYHLRWQAEPYEALAVEVQFETDLRNPETGAPSRTWRLGGKLDGVVRDLRDGRVLILEHKTSSEDVTPGSDYWKRLRMDGQVSAYYEGARALGFDVAGCIYDVIKKPTIRPSAVPVLDENGEKVVVDANGQRVRTKDGKKWRQTGDSAAGYALQTRPETPEEFRARLVESIAADPVSYFARGEVVRLEADIAEAQHDTWQIARQMREAELAGRFPRNPDACMHFGRPCQFFDVCTGSASLDDPSQFRKLEDVHPELAE